MTNFFLDVVIFKQRNHSIQHFNTLFPARR